MKQAKKKGRSTEPAPLPIPPAAHIPAPDNPLLTSTWLHSALILLVGIAAYSNTFSVPFYLDDYSSIVENPVIQDLRRFLSGDGYAFNPRRFVGYLSLALNYHFGGLDVIGYHVVNVAIHLINAFLVYALVLLTLRTPFFVKGEECNGGAASGTIHHSPFTSFIALFAALFFVAHPLQTQAVTYIIQRLASLATLFYLGAVVCYAKGRIESVSSKQEEAKEPLSPFTVHHSPYLWYTLALASALLAMRSKEISATLPVAILMYEFFFFGATDRKKRLLILLPVALLALIVPISLALADKPVGDLLSDISEATRETTDLTRTQYLLSQFTVIATYLRLVVFPINQSLEYNHILYQSLFEAEVLPGFLLICFLLAMGGLAWYVTSPRKGSGKSLRGSKTHRPELRLASFGIFWFFLALSVESSIIPIRDLIFEHRVYLPLTGAAFVAAALYCAAKRHISSKYLVLLPLLLILILAGATWKRNLLWRDPLKLWQDAAEKAPLNDRPFANLSHLYFNKKELSTALEYAKTAVELNPLHYGNFFNLGAVHEEMGQLNEAIQNYREGIRLKPDDVVTRNKVAVLYKKMGRLDLAETELQKELSNAPDNAVAYSNYSLVLGQQGKLDEAIQYAKSAIKLAPDFADAYKNLGTAYLAKGDLDQGQMFLEKALKLDDSNAEAHNNVGYILMQKKDCAGAVNHFKRAVELKPQDTALRENLAAAQKCQN